VDVYSGWRRLDSWIGIHDRLDKDHPEIMLMKNMTEEEELEYISKRYVPDKDWETEPKKKKK